MQQTAGMLVDAFEPEGFTTLAKDSIFMMPHLGVLAEVHPRAALEVFERDCLIYLGTCIAAKGAAKPGKECFKYQISGATLNESGTMHFGEIKLFPLGEGETVTVAAEPARQFDLGPGKRVEREVRGGTVGLILDARGRPLELPLDRKACREAATGWVKALNLY
jgi:hypothetical protein